ncbi:type I-E CRISPR-associated protein Cse2/CasB [Corynebacterium felinum]|uniref:CRISPR system Cascade subunit CasB n=1 Tax=Corynebacterium felinum TaxID=131318 RepID=A0ABU2B4W9_9CORY|nr:type I-E CRISPR-associated protein Cse2/CasB [Corynebacterium felinum]MDF5820575.1 type I-E CRISPR-associated protein Cse2/CasB [Corynebacterium felinum]MDR7353656.1 CRISPR system Cascade subunit CasB [Corynebacterium felinum]WJY95835.1 CRISPR-associated protein Cse2 [Corynebacterium felinum]
MTSKSKQLSEFIYRTIEQYQQHYLQGAPHAKADLANFRRLANKQLGDSPETWAVFSHGFPPQLIGNGFQPSPAETAAFISLTLFASHIQSKHEPMHLKNEGLGDALRKYAVKTNTDLFESSLFKRFNSVIHSPNMEGIAYHLRSLVQLFRSESIPLDYGKLATDLYRMQFPDSRTSTQLSWARQLYRTQTIES